MKKLYFLFALAFIAISQMSFAAPLVIKKATGPIVLDGAKTDAAWANATNIKVDKPYVGEKVVGGSLDVSILYDTDNLYFFFDVKDDVVTLDNAADYKGDKVELYFGLPESILGWGAGEDHARQFFYNADLTWASDASKVNHQTWYTESMWPGQASSATDGSDYSYVETIDGYKFEAKINKSALENVDFATIDTLAFDVYLVDNDIIGDGFGVRNRLAYHNIGTVNENWNAMDLVGMVFEKSTGVNSPKAAQNLVFVSGSSLKSKSGNIVNIEILDLSGRSILTASQVNSVNISTLNKGAYFAKVKDGSITSVSKFIR